MPSSLPLLFPAGKLARKTPIINGPVSWDQSNTDDQVAAAIKRVPTSSNHQIETMRINAAKKGIHLLVEACDQELHVRGSHKFTSAEAEMHALWAKEVEGFDLSSALLHAFKRQPLNDEEQKLVSEIARSPDIDYETLSELRGKGDVGLIIGHIIYERLGFFRNFLGTSADPISDLILVRDRSGRSVKYSLRDYARDVFSALGYF